MSDLILAFGSEIKAMGDGKVGGYLVRFTSAEQPDLHGDYFTKATDFDIADGDRASIYYNHGLDRTLKRRKLGSGTLRMDDVGIWIDAQLEMRDDYERAIYGMAEAGKLGWSSGTLPNLVEREVTGDAAHIKSWPLGKDASMTPTPAAGLVATQVQPLKTWAEATEHFQVMTGQPEHIAEITEAKTTEDARPASSLADDSGAIDDNISDGGLNMSDEKVPAQVGSSESPDAEIKALRSQVDTLSAQLEKVLKAMESEPALERAGFVTNIGGAADPSHKSLGDFFLAVRRNDGKRLKSVYGSAYEHSDKAMGEDSGVGGGYLVPHEYSAQLIQMAQFNNLVYNRVTKVPVGVQSGTYPTLDQFTAPTAGAGNTAFAAGVTAAVTAEAGTLTSTDPAFEALQWRVHKIGGYTQASNELAVDSPMALEPLLRMLFANAIGARNERNILRGTGVGEPLGILNSTAIINVSPGTNSAFTWVDVATMKSRHKIYGSQPVWLIHPGVWPDILTMEIGTAGAAAWTGNMAGGGEQPLLGYPIIQSEHLPQDDNSGDVILADLSAYVLFERGGLSIAYSEHVGFLTDQGTWRFTVRNDGMPWVRYPVTLADPQGSYTVSPFVVHND